jgi:signal recognition particle receptor subunit beta
VFLIFANKQDLPEAMSEEEIIGKLNLGDLKCHTWHIQKCSAMSGEGIDEGLDWLHSKLHEKQKK